MCGGATTVGRSSMAPHQLPYADDDIDRPIGIAHRPIRINRDRNPQPSVSSHPRGGVAYRRAAIESPAAPTAIGTPIHEDNRISALLTSSKSSTAASTSEIIMSPASSAQRDDARSCNRCGASRGMSEQTVGGRSTVRPVRRKAETFARRSATRRAGDNAPTSHYRSQLAPRRTEQ